MSLVVIRKSIDWDNELPYDQQTPEAQQEAENLMSQKEPEVSVPLSTEEGGDWRTSYHEWLYPGSSAGEGFKMRMTLSYPYPLWHARALQSDRESVEAIII